MGFFCIVFSGMANGVNISNYLKINEDLTFCAKKSGKVIDVQAKLNLTKFSYFTEIINAFSLIKSIENETIIENHAIKDIIEILKKEKDNLSYEILIRRFDFIIEQMNLHFIMCRVCHSL